MEGNAVMEFSRVSVSDPVEIDFKVNNLKELNISPATSSVQQLKAAGVFKCHKLMDFEYQPEATSDQAAPELKNLTVYQAPPRARGVSVGRMFSDGTIALPVKVGSSAWVNRKLSLEDQEIIFKLWQASGVLPVGLESRVSATKVTLLFLTRVFL